MIVNRKWLEKYTDIPFTSKDLEDKLTYLGLEATTLKNKVSDIENLIVGKVLDIEKHPDADKLTVCKVSDGTNEFVIVCGAPNVAKGQIVPVALPGCMLPAGFKIKASKIRGVKSYGMICAEDELGLSDNHSGIMVLDTDTELGITLGEYFDGKGANYEIDLTPNRPDCTSHIGVARDITLLTDNELRIPEINIEESDISVEKNIDIDIQDLKGCPRYAARIIKNIKVSTSPKWLVDYLESVGLRSINNIVDISNFVLMETGHPLHTFNLDKVYGNKIVVRKARKDETVITLDEVERKLTEDILLICDGEKPVAIAGIMGLQNSEIDDETVNILIESAYFDPSTVRKGSKLLGLQTDASYRFERGADPENVTYALDRITSLIQEIAGGEVSKGIFDLYPEKITYPRITVRFNRIDKLIGYEFDKNWVLKKFRQLGCEIHSNNEQEIELTSPSWRPDLEREVDYIEEVVRIFGMENVPAAKNLQIKATYEINEKYVFIEKLRTDLCGNGYMEVYNNSLVSSEMAEFSLSKFKPIELHNPLSRDMAYLRTSLIPGMLNTVKLNINRKNLDLKLFELGIIQQYDEESETKAKESNNFAIALTGKIESIHWEDKPRNSNIYYLKGIIEEVCYRYNINKLEFKFQEHEYFSGLIIGYINGKEFCKLGQLKGMYLNKVWDIEKDVFILEANADLLFEYYNPEIRYVPLPKFPGSERDISIVIKEEILVEQIIAIINKNGGKLLKEVKFYDYYKGKNIEDGKKSLTFNLYFENTERTLKDKEIDKIMSKIHNNLKKELNAELR